MENNKQNTALLVVIAVATLLVAVVGATFAYFTAAGTNGSTSIVEITGGKMAITYGDGSNEVNLTKTGFEPSDTVLIEKKFTLKGINTSIGNSDDVSKGIAMPYTVELEYKNGFTTGQLHYTITRTDENTSVTSSLDETAKTKSGTLNKTVVPTEKNSNKVTYNDGSKDVIDENKAYETLVTGAFPAVRNDTGTSIGFTFKMTFPDTGASQDENKGAQFYGKIVVNRDINSNKAK